MVIMHLDRQDEECGWGHMVVKIKEGFKVSVNSYGRLIVLDSKANELAVFMADKVLYYTIE